MTTKVCNKCNTTKDVTDFYPNKTHKHGVMPYCKSCFNKYTVDRWIERKIKAIEYKGGKCEDCNLSHPTTHYAVFEFHHIDPTQKDHDWTKLRLRAWATVLSELDKCVLLCANCHRIRHSK